MILDDGMRWENKKLPLLIGEKGPAIAPAALLLLRGLGGGVPAAGGIAQPGRWGPPLGTQIRAGTLGGLETSPSAHPLYFLIWPFLGQFSVKGVNFGEDALFKEL